MQSASSNKGVIIGIAVVTVLIFVGLVWAVMMAPSGSNTTGEEKNLVFQDQNDPTLGPVNSKVLVRLFGDFQCPACRVAEAGVRYAMEKYKDRVQFIWNDFPLTTIHPNARLAANAARCAEDQGKFWEYHDKLYTAQTEWADVKSPQEKFNQYASELGLNKENFSSCLSVQAQNKKVGDDMDEGFKNNVDRTPTVFVNNRRYFSLSPAEWDTAITSALQSSASSTPQS